MCVKAFGAGTKTQQFNWALERTNSSQKEPNLINTPLLYFSNVPMGSILGFKVLPVPVLVAQQRNLKPPYSVLWRCCWCFPGLVSSPSEASIHPFMVTNGLKPSWTHCHHVSMAAELSSLPLGPKNSSLVGKLELTHLSPMWWNHILLRSTTAAKEKEFQAPVLSVFTKPTKMSSSKDKTTSKLLLQKCWQQKDIFLFIVGHSVRLVLSKSR